MVQHAARDWPDQHRRRLYRIALNFFNKKPDRGVQLLIHWGFVEDSPQAIAKLFLGRRGLSKQMIGEFLGTLHSPFHAAVLERFINEIPMFDMEIDVALRQLLTHFRLPGEAQKIDHIMQMFSKKYRSSNPGRLPPHLSPDTIYVLAFAIIMLNTDLHTPSLKDSKRMKLDEFIKNVCGIEEGSLLDRGMLTGIYERIKEREFRPGSDHVTQVMKVDQSIVGKDKPKLVEPHRRLICYCRLHQVLDPHKKQAVNAHQREIFLFNDLMIVAKVFTRKKSVGQYAMRYWTPLIGLRITEFQNAFYSNGLIINCPDGQEFFFNAKNHDDRFRFAADVKESIAESTEMEQIRIDLELDKQQCANGLGGGLGTMNNRFVRADSQRDSGLPDIDHHSPSLPPMVADGGRPFPATSATYTQNGTGNGSLNCSSSTGPPSANGTPAVAVRRLSYNSLDSGVVEETADLSV
ncbi:loner ISO1 [Aphelenchoides avenae]|nr:loner ISO1 [Aphelenchus avenae]